MRTITFASPPSTRKDATLYQHAQEVKRVVEGARSHFEAFDNHDQVDLNSAQGKVIVDQRQPVKGLACELVGAQEVLENSFLFGHLVNGQLKATLSENPKPGGWPGLEDQQVVRTETDRDISYQVETPLTNRLFSGLVKVVEDKSQGSLTLTEGHEGCLEAVKIPHGISLVQEKCFPADGPQSIDDGPFYRQGQELKSELDGMMDHLKWMDDGPRDLNPEAGVVVVAGFRELVGTGGKGTVPLEADLHFDPKDGTITDFSSGFGDQQAHKYQLRDGAQSYRGLTMGLEIGADGQRIQREYR
ncbi:hypothetical protein IV102_15770 [bacterium]|nr:hypothetical protein [bacterium]